MYKVVLDTNILVSAAISRLGNPAKIMSMVFDLRIQPVYNEKIIAEYENVLSRPRFNISSDDKSSFIEGIKRVGEKCSPPASKILLPDESDRIFFDTAVTSAALVITGNSKHYPDEPFVLSPAQFLASFENNL